MPRQAKMKTKTKPKRPYKRKSIMGISRQPIAPVAQQQVVKMIYAEVLPLNALSIGQAATYQFRTNSIFDPDYTGVGHQPLGHDQWALFYNHYCVISSTIRVDFLPSSTAIGGNILCAIRVSPDSGATTIPTTQLLENRQAVTGVLMATGKGCRLRNTYNLKKQFGYSAALGTTNSAQFGFNPAEDCYYHCSIGPYDTSVQAQAFLVVKIEYTVLLLEPKTLSQS